MHIYGLLCRVEYWRLIKPLVDSVYCSKDPGYIRMNIHDSQNMKDDVRTIFFSPRALASNNFLSMQLMYNSPGFFNTIRNNNYIALPV